MSMTNEQVRKCAEAMLLVDGWLEEFRETKGRDILTYQFSEKGKYSLFFPGIGDSKTPNCFDVFLGRRRDHVEFKLKFYINLDSGGFDKIDCVINTGDTTMPPYEPFREFLKKVSNELKRPLESDNRRKELEIVKGKDNAESGKTLKVWLENHFEDLQNALRGVMLGEEEFNNKRETCIERAGWLGTDAGGKYFVRKEANFQAEGSDNSTENANADATTDQDEEKEEMKPRNHIYFGAPGTGKSFKLNQKACRHKENGVDKVGAFDDENGTRYERVTFYPTYSYAQFVGTYKPVMKPIAEDPSKEEISYEFVPGPFLRVLVNALNDNDNKDWCLIIEEINRANAAAVFGDVFQLLDRNSEGESEYSIAVSEDVKRFLSHDQKEGGLSAEGKEALKNLTGTEDMSRIQIPRNMYLWATMNSADQGVFPMDTAFKRRWEFEYMAIDEGGDDYCEGWKVKNDSGEEYKWNALRKFLNRLLELNGVNEDKLMGPFFVKAKDNQIDLKQFTSKVLMYLWEDAARMCRAKIFGDDIRSYSKLVDKWQEQGLEIFEAAKQKANDKDLNSLFPSALPKSGDSNGGSISSDSVGAGENGSQG